MTLILVIFDQRTCRFIHGPAFEAIDPTFSFVSRFFFEINHGFRAFETFISFLLCHFMIICSIEKTMKNICA